MKRMVGDTNQFIVDQRAMLEALMAFKQTLKNMVPLKMQERQYYASFATFLTSYELAKEKASKVGESAHVKLVTGQGGDYLKSKLEGLAQEYKNPMMHVSHFVKGEVYSLEALTGCVNEMNNIDMYKRQTVEDIKKT